MDAQSPVLKRCEELWYEDGTVVLRAGILLYRVYSGMLSRESAFFKTMFSLPQADDGGERYEGLPFVHLPDNEYEVTEFLKAIHYPRYAENSVAENMDTLAALLRLGTKYEVPAMRSFAIATLEAACPSTLAATRDLKPKRRVEQLAEYKVMLFLARECDVPHVVPVCLWKLLPQSPSSESLRLLRESVVSPRSGIEYRLDEATITSLLVAVWRCSDRYGQVARVVFEQSDDCQTSEDCEELLRMGRDYASPFDILKVFKDMTHLPVYGLCPRCAEAGETEWEDEAETTWDILPGFFDLPPWTELGKEQTSEES